MFVFGDWWWSGGDLDLDPKWIYYILAYCKGEAYIYVYIQHRKY